MEVHITENEDIILLYFSNFRQY